jgi:hypothetical protein
LTIPRGAAAGFVRVAFFTQQHRLPGLRAWPEC